MICLIKLFFVLMGALFCNFTSAAIVTRSECACRSSDFLAIRHAGYDSYYSYASTNGKFLLETEYKCVESRRNKIHACDRSYDQNRTLKVEQENNRFIFNRFNVTSGVFEVNESGVQELLPENRFLELKYDEAKSYVLSELCLEWDC